MGIKKVYIAEDCTACFMCQDLCPAVFKVDNNSSSVIEGVNYDEHADYIRDAVKACPVEVIKIEEDSSEDIKIESKAEEIFDPFS